MNYNQISSIFIATLLLLSNLKVEAQNIFDSTHTDKYAYYLFSTHDFELAAEEYERLLFMSNGQNDSLHWMLARTNRLSGKPAIGLKKMLIAYPDTNFNSSLLSKEYLKLLFANHDYNLPRKEIKRLSNLDSTDRLVFSISNEFFAGNYKTACQTTNSSLNNSAIAPFKDVVSNVNRIKHKSTAMAGTLSVLIPGLGQTYAGNWKDGIFALALTGGASLQAYRGFRRDGINSAYGWGFSALASAFYMANIYGAIKATNKYNFLNHIKISYQVEAILDNYYN